MEFEGRLLVFHAFQSAVKNGDNSRGTTLLEYFFMLMTYRHYLAKHIGSHVAYIFFDKLLLFYRFEREVINQYIVKFHVGMNF